MREIRTHILNYVKMVPDKTKPFQAWEHISGIIKNNLKPKMYDGKEERMEFLSIKPLEDSKFHTLFEVKYDVPERMADAKYWEENKD
ncbi:hypothetical protein OAC15_04150 [Alphaproteobacteria bacterium]|nr:hypothetical protein [Alphaproteobacteria bacterium]